MSKQNKSAKIRKLLTEGKTPVEIAKAVKCSLKLVYVVRSQWMRLKPIEFKTPQDETPRPKIDMINQPPHYTNTDVEPINAIEAWQLNYRLGNVVKYVARANFKDNYLEDLKKARWYLDREIAKSEEQ